MKKPEPSITIKELRKLFKRKSGYDGIWWFGHIPFTAVSKKAMLSIITATAKEKVKK